MSDISAPPDEFLQEFFQVYRYLLERAAVLKRVDPDIQFTSWFRTKSQNQAAGGDPQSQHLFGFAIDVVPRNPELVEQVANQIGIITVREFDHLHLQLFPSGLLARLGFFAIGV